MDKNILIDLFERRDKKRRKILYEQYEAFLATSLSAPYVAEMISKDLGKQDLVNAADIRYCRFYFKDKPVVKTPMKATAKMPSSPDKPEVRPAKPNGNKSVMIWSDPDKMSTQDNVIVKSKFSKKNET